MQGAVSRASGCFRSSRAKCRITFEKPRANIVIQCTVNRASGSFRSSRVKSRTVYGRSRAVSRSFPTRHVRGRRRFRRRGGGSTDISRFVTTFRGSNLLIRCLESTFPEIRSSTFRIVEPTSGNQIQLRISNFVSNQRVLKSNLTARGSSRHFPNHLGALSGRSRDELQAGNVPPVSACRTRIASSTAPQRRDVTVLRKQPECYARCRTPQAKLIVLVKFPPEVERTVPFRTPDLPLALLASLDVDKR